MSILYLLIVMALTLPSVAAFFISSLVFNKVAKAGLKAPRFYQVIAFVFSFAMVLAAIGVLALYNFRIER